MDVARDQALFNRWAASYDRSPLQFFFFGPTQEAVLRAVETGPAPRKILDLGCGTGRLLERAAGRWPEARLLGIDTSTEMIARARGKHAGDPRFTFEVGDAAALPLEPASIDLALTTVSFHHWADQPGGVREVARVLGPAGRFILADIRPPIPLRPLMRRFHGPRSRRRLFQQAGLAVLRQSLPLRLGGSILVTVGAKP